MARKATMSLGTTDGSPTDILGTSEEAAIGLAGDPAGQATHAQQGDTVIVRVQLRPRRPAARRCLAVLTDLGGQHEQVGFSLEGISSDDRVVRLTLAIDLGPRADVARFGPDAQAAYAFVNALFVSLYDHMPVYTAESSEAEKQRARALLAMEATGPDAERTADLATESGVAAVRDHLGVPAVA